MCFFISLIPATIWVVLGYFILFSSNKTVGEVQRFGQILAIWVFNQVREGWCGATSPWDV
jgi:hypothetical protein